MDDVIVDDLGGGLTDELAQLRQGNEFQFGFPSEEGGDKPAAPEKGHGVGGDGAEALAQGLLSLVDGQLKELGDVIAVHVMQGCQSQIGELDLFSVGEFAIDAHTIPAPLGIDGQPFAAGNVAGMDDGGGETLGLIERAEVGLDLCLLDAVVGDRLAREGFFVGNLFGGTVGPDGATVEEVADAPFKSVDHEPILLGGIADQVDHDVGFDTLHPIGP